MHLKTVTKWHIFTKTFRQLLGCFVPKPPGAPHWGHGPQIPILSSHFKWPMIHAWCSIQHADVAITTPVMPVYVCAGESDVYNNQNEGGHCRSGTGRSDCRVRLWFHTIAIFLLRYQRRVLRGRSGDCSDHQRAARAWSTSSVHQRRRQSRTSSPVNLVQLRRAHRHGDRHFTGLRLAPRNGVDHVPHSKLSDL